ARPGPPRAASRARLRRGPRPGSGCAQLIGKGVLALTSLLLTWSLVAAFPGRDGAGERRLPLITAGWPLSATGGKTGRANGHHSSQNRPTLMPTPALSDCQPVMES